MAGIKSLSLVGDTTNRAIVHTTKVTYLILILNTYIIQIENGMITDNVEQLEWYIKTESGTLKGPYIDQLAANQQMIVEQITGTIVHCTPDGKTMLLG